MKGLFSIHSAMRMSMGIACIAVLLLACGAGDRTVRELAPGVAYHRVHLLEGPWWIHIVEIDLDRAWRAEIGRAHV